MNELTFRSQRLRSALDWWERKRGNRRMPLRRELDPVEIPHLLAWLALMEVIPEPLDFRYRIIGDALLRLLAQNYTGRLLSSLPGKGPGSILWGNFEAVVRTAAPYSRVPPYVGPVRWVRSDENVLLPFSTDGESVSHILLVVECARDDPPPAKPPPDPIRRR